MADAYATAFNAMGYEKAYNFANKNNIAALFILEMKPCHSRVSKPFSQPNGLAFMASFHLIVGGCFSRLS